MVQDEIGNAVTGAGLTPTKGTNNQLLAAINALALQAGAHGQCRLRFATPNLKLSPLNGNRLLVNNQQQQIPQSGVLLSPTSSISIAASTLYFIYAALFSSNVSGAANNGSGLVRLAVASTAELVTGNTLAVAGVGGTTEANGSWVVTVIDGTHVDLQGSAFAHAYTSGGTATGLVLEASTTGHSTAANGVETKSTDVTRTLVGLALSTAGSAWQGGVFCLSWFNRAPLTQAVPFTSSPTTSSTTFVELNSAFRNSFLIWGDDELFADFSGSAACNTALDSNWTTLSYNGAAAEDIGVTVTSATANSAEGVAVAGRKTGLAEGLNYATALGLTSNTTTSTWAGGATVGQRCQLTVSVRG